MTFMEINFPNLEMLYSSFGFYSKRLFEKAEYYFPMSLQTRFRFLLNPKAPVFSQIKSHSYLNECYSKQYHCFAITSLLI